MFKTIFSYIILHILTFASITNSQWIQQVSGTPRHLFGIDMLDLNTGFVSCEQCGRILKTTNGGINWIGYNEPTSDQYNSVSFINASTGLAVGPPGILLRTSNGGINWSVISQPGGDKGPVQFVSQNVAYAAGDDVIKSTDGGLTWFIVLTGSILSQYQGLYFINETTGTVVGRPGLIRTTTDGGASWINRTMFLPVQFGDSTLFDVIYVNSSIGYACGNNGIVMKTANGGINWVYSATGVLSGLFGVYFSDVNSGTIVGNTGRIMRTTNGGNNWLNQASPLNYPLSDVEFIDINTGWIVGFNGLILKTTNGGITWLEPISYTAPEHFNLEQNYPNPFNPSTKIKFSVKQKADISITIYNSIGAEIEKIVYGELSPGEYETVWDAKNLPSGIYFIEMRTSTGFKSIRKAVLIK